MKLTFVGGGNMAAALIGGLLAKGTAPNAIKVIEVLPEARARLHAQTGVSVFASAEEAKPYGDVVVLAVKPQHMRQVARELAPHLSGELVVSIAAGIRLADLDRWLEHRVRLVRCMPNTPALIGHGIAGLYAGSDVTGVDREAAQTVLEAVGRAVWVDDEALLDPVTAVSGSGPAYVFYFIEALEEAGVKLGLPPAAARELAVQTLRGAAELAARSGESPGTLRERVTSKGGTTERALASLAEDDVKGAIIRAVAAASARGRELGELLGKE